MPGGVGGVTGAILSPRPDLGVRGWFKEVIGSSCLLVTIEVVPSVRLPGLG